MVSMVSTSSSIVCCPVQFNVPVEGHDAFAVLIEGEGLFSNLLS
jgi:hypothetical protein